MNESQYDNQNYKFTGDYYFCHSVGYVEQYYRIFVLSVCQYN
jgi:hypothetical protein